MDEMGALMYLLLISTLLVSKCMGGDLWNPSCDGRQVIIQMFEWKWTDIALECERFLSQAEYCGVQISPPEEHLHPPDEYKYPWWERYQPISYNLHSRSGTEAELIDMVQRCNAVKVRIFVDTVVNHMAGLGRTGYGIDGSYFDSDAHDFPGVPYTDADFTPREMCPSGDGNVNNYGDPDNVRNCNLVGLTDLYGATDNVRQLVSGYFNSLVDIGVAGFRIDASKHMWPDDLAAMIALTHDLNTDQGFPANTKPFFYHEVIDRNDGAVTVDQYYDLGRVTEFRYCQKIKEGIDNFYNLQGVYDPGWFMADPEHAFVFVDNHDNQRGQGHENSILTYENPHTYRLGIAFTLAQPYGFTRIMSSYYMDTTDYDEGPPHYSDYSTKDVIIDDQNECQGGWVCEHRWESIYKMARFRNAVNGTDWENYYSTDNIVAFSRGNLGFFAMVKSGTLSQSFQTGMPQGTYEEIVSCTPVTVGADGMAQVDITNEEEPVFAICQGCNCEIPPTVTATPGPDVTTISTTTTSGPTSPPITEGIARTVVFVQKQTNDGQNLFIRGGGNDISNPPGCNLDDVTNDPCSISMSTNSLGDTQHYDNYNAWRIGDNYLDWMGAEPTQGTNGGEVAEGTPLAWTSSSSSSPGYQPLNVYGDHYWMVDTDMDCSETTDGWFEFKAYLTNDATGWEGDVDQDAACSGSAGGAKPYTSANHFGRCGYINVVTFDSPECTVEDF